MSVGDDLIASWGSGDAWRRLVATGIGLASLAMGLVLNGCGQKIASADQLPSVSAERMTAALEPATRLSEASREAEPTETSEDGDDAVLRRGYGVVDMRLNECVSKVNDHALHAAGCSPGIVVYGPYVPVPANSAIEVSFELKPTKRVEVYADIVSQMGSRTLAGLHHQVVEAGAQRRFGYKVHVFDADVNVESRIGVTGEAGAEFDVTNVTMTVR